jgi:acetoin utilization deacetylase AcuC-like enzyme
LCTIISGQEHKTFPQYSPRSARRPGRTAIFTHEHCRAHDTGPDHPERPARLGAALEAVARADDGTLLHVPASPATREQVLAVHDAQYVSLVRREIAAGVRCLSTGDTNVSAASWQSALAAAGAVVGAVDALWTGGDGGAAGGAAPVNAFCAVRPPGHHASADRGMGYCVLNNVAIGARHAQRAHRAERVLILDWDLHHGNGTAEIFYDDPTVLYFSIHQSPWYPGTGQARQVGTGRGRGYTINCPLSPGSDGADVREAFDRQLRAPAEAFAPELVMISAGFDARRGDPLGRLKLVDDDYVWMTAWAMDLADRFAGGRLVSVLEGGYDLPGLRSAIEAHVRTLMGR